MYFNKKGQGMEVSILVFAMIIIGIFFLAPIILMVFNTITTQFGVVAGNTSAAYTNMNYIKNSFTGFWDWIIIIAFLAMVLMLFISAFMIDVHPIWIVLYIVFGMFMFILVPSCMDVVNMMYNTVGTSGYADYVVYLPMLDFIRQNYMILLLGIYVLSGLVTYGKYRLIGGGQR